MTVKKLMHIEDVLNEAVALLQVAGPNPICISSEEYFERLYNVYDACGIGEDEEE